jgi:pimeloyl-ACP methyl ester carboxylesterase
MPDAYLSRRSAIGRLAGAGAAAALAASQFGAFPIAARGASPTIPSSITTPKEGTNMTESTPTATAVPTVVLVHGAFADSSSWNGVIPPLLEQGYPVVAAANPLRSLTIDADYVANVLSGIPGPIVLVGHSYGGSVISNAATGNSNVKALVFVAGFAPDTGESAVALSGRFPGSTLGSALTPLPLTGGGNDLYIQKDVFWTQFAADVPEGDSALMAATQRPVTDAALAEGSGDPAWKTIPSWFIYGENDKNIPAAVQVFMAERAGAKQAIEVPGASHVVMISQPQAVVDMIMAAISAVS